MTNTKYFYIRQPDKKNPHHRGAPIACVAYQRSKDPDVQDTDVVLFALSVANPDADEFNKKKARKIASGRLNCKRTTADGFQVADTATSTDVIRGLVSYIEDSSLYGLSVPSRVRNAAAKWLKKTAPKVEVEA